MGRTHAQQFANETLPRAVFADPLAFTRAIAAGKAAAALAARWDEAGAELAPIARAPGTGLAASLTVRGLYAIALVTPPVPRASGDPAAIVLIGRGDGADKLTTLAYYVLELVLDPVTGAPSFALVARSRLGEREASWRDGPLPDASWLADHAFELYAGRVPDARDGIADLPGWYWWHAHGGASAVRAFADAAGDRAHIDCVRAAPSLLLPEIADTAEQLGDARTADRLRELTASYLRHDAVAPVWEALIERLAIATTGSAPTNVTRALRVVADAGAYAIPRARAFEIEAALRSKLAVLGIDRGDNYARSEQLFAAARRARAPRIARGSVAAPSVPAEDPVWRPLFLDATDLPAHALAETGEWSEPAFAAHGGLRAGHAVWTADDRSPLACIVDTRWVFRTAAGAAAFVRAAAPVFADGMPAIPAPPLGDDALAFAGERAGSIAVRVGRVVARLHAVEGASAAAAREILHAATLHPLADRIAQRARRAVAAYWLAVAAPTNAIAALVHSPGYDAASLLASYPLLAHPELPATIAMADAAQLPAARALASFQAQLRAHRWAAYRDAMLALVRCLLATDAGDPRVNAAHAAEIVAELGALDSDPIWLRLDADCRARAYE